MKKLILLLTLLGLAACSGNAPRLEPPNLGIVEIQLSESRSTLDARLRLRNTSARKLPANSLNFSLEIDGNSLGSFEPDLSYDIPALGSEVVEISAPLPPAVASSFAVLDRGARSRIPYRIDGELIHSDGQGRMRIESSGYISPTPGKPASYR